MTSEQELVQKFRNGLFLASSRTYAEQYVEPLIRAKYDLLEPTGGHHDALSRTGIRYEIKASKVLHPTGNGKNSRTLFDRIMFESDQDTVDRVVGFDERLNADFLANIQNVKRDHFEELIYVLLFSDSIKIFIAKTTDIRKGAFPSWSDKHGLYDALGKSGQFPINKSNIEWHLEHHLDDSIDYAEAAGIAKRISISK
jgi:hypothetical protein